MRLFSPGLADGMWVRAAMGWRRGGEALGVGCGPGAEQGGVFWYSWSQLQGKNT